MSHEVNVELFQMLEKNQLHPLHGKCINTNTDSKCANTQTAEYIEFRIDYEFRQNIYERVAVAEKHIAAGSRPVLKMLRMQTAKHKTLRSEAIDFSRYGLLQNGEHTLVSINHG